MDTEIIEANLPRGEKKLSGWKTFKAGAKMLFSRDGGTFIAVAFKKAFSPRSHEPYDLPTMQEVESMERQTRSRDDQQDEIIEEIDSQARESSFNLQEIEGEKYVHVKSLNLFIPRDSYQSILSLWNQAEKNGKKKLYADITSENETNRKGEVKIRKTITYKEKTCMKQRGEELEQSERVRKIINVTDREERPDVTRRENDVRVTINPIYRHRLGDGNAIQAWKLLDEALFRAGKIAVHVETILEASDRRERMKEDKKKEDAKKAKRKQEKMERNLEKFERKIKELEGAETSLSQYGGWKTTIGRKLVNTSIGRALEKSSYGRAMGFGTIRGVELFEAVDAPQEGGMSQETKKRKKPPPLQTFRRAFRTSIGEDSFTPLNSPTNPNSPITPNSPLTPNSVTEEAVNAPQEGEMSQETKKRKEPPPRLISRRTSRTSIKQDSFTPLNSPSIPKSPTTPHSVTEENEEDHGSGKSSRASSIHKNNNNHKKNNNGINR